MGQADPWCQEERSLLASLDTPWKIQQYLDALPYSSEHGTRSPRRVMRDRLAHCTEGALFAAAALRFHGRPPLLIDLQADNDDNHILAVYRENRCLGAVAKSNYTTLRFREAIYRNPRELALSYFELYYNTLGEKTLRGYSRMVDISRFDEDNWMTTEDDLDWLDTRLQRMRHYALLTAEMVAALHPMDAALYQAGLQGADPAGLYQPEGRQPEATR